MLVSDPSSSNPSGNERRSISETPSTGTRPRSPASIDAPSSTTGRVRVPAKRARKAINCGPCRLSKLKCDRDRPCSSCKLRGTTASCYYQGQDDGSPAAFRTDVSSDPRSVNTAVEFSKIRQALALVEAHVNYMQRLPALSGSAPSQPSFGASTILGPSQLKENLSKSDLSEPEAAPGARGQSNRSGLYAGSTSTVSHLPSGFRDGNGVPEAAENTPERTHDCDYDLFNELPHPSVIEGLIDFYFEYCNWVYRHVNYRAFMTEWARYKSGAGADRTVLATVCMIMAVTVHYLPAGHELLRGLLPDTEELGAHFYNVMRLALQRKQTESRAYTLELVELLLIRSHYLILSKIDSEETWHVKGELVNIATAMGLHRDPGDELLLEVAERRRWAWWNIITVERSQAFIFGRPIAIASHHFDTRLPSYCDPEVDPSGKLYEANIHLFRLAFILGNIMDDAVSLRPVPYESVLAKDRILQEWWDKLPTELDMDDYTLVSFLASSTTSKRRIGVQSVVARTALLHIRFTMHRPYASLAHGGTSKYATSLEISINAADKLIVLSAHVRPEMLNHAALAGHMTWGLMHCFSAAVFFCFQIINNPEQAGARHLRASVLRAITTLESCRGMRVAEKALDILRALGPLYTEEFLADTLEDREHKKQAVLPAVRILQFPYVDSPNGPIGAAAAVEVVTGSGNGTLSPAQSSAHSTDSSPPRSGPGTDMMQPPHPGVQGTTVHAREPEILSMTAAPMLQPPQHSTCENLPSLKWPHANMAVGDPAQYLGQRQQRNPTATQQQQQQQYRDALPHQPVKDEEAMWRSAAHHAQTATMVRPESANVSAPPSRALYAQQMIQQDAYSSQGGDGAAGGSSSTTVDGRMGSIRVGAEGVLWGATSGFVQGEWDRMYTGLGCQEG